MSNLLSNDRDIGKATGAQQVASAVAESRALNVDFAKKKSQELKYRRRRAEVCIGYILSDLNCSDSEVAIKAGQLQQCFAHQCFQ